MFLLPEEVARHRRLWVLPRGHPRLRQGGHGGVVSAGSDDNRLRQGREGGAVAAAGSEDNLLRRGREVPINIVACVIDGCILVPRNWLLNVCKNQELVFLSSIKI